MENNNHHINQQFDEFFKQSFEKFEPELPQGTWENIDQSVGQSTTTTIAGSSKVFSSVLFKVAAALLPLAGIIYYVSQQSETSIQPIIPQTQSSERQVLIETEQINPLQPESEVEGNDVSPTPSQESKNQSSFATGKATIQSGLTSSGSISTSQHNQTSRTGTDLHNSVSHRKADLPRENGEQTNSKSQAPVLTFTVSKTDLCTDENIEFNTTSAGFDRYRWDFDDGHYYDQLTAGKAAHKFDKAGWYNVTLLGYKGNKAERYSVRLRVIKPMAYFVVKTDDAPKLHFINQSKYAQHYEWDFGDHTIGRDVSPSHTFEPDAKAWVRLIARNGTCADTFTLEVNANLQHAKENDMHIPNVFTPNQDGINDDWSVMHSEGELKITILDRSGRKIFETTDAGKKWTGADANGKECPSGDYFYIIHCKSADGKEFTRTGLIKLMR